MRPGGPKASPLGMAPFLILQLRPETAASDDEFAAFLRKGGLSADQTHRVRLDQSDLPDDLDLSDYSGVIVGGGPGCVSDPPDKKSAIDAKIENAVLGLMPRIVAEDIPFMGCCYGIGILAHHMGARVDKSRWGEPVGTSDCTLTEAGRADPLLDGLPERFDTFVGHKEAVQELPEDCVHLMKSPTCRYQMIRAGKNVYATQFHPEADGDVFAVRIATYRNYGYFAPEEADALTAMARAADVEVPEVILRRFVTRYARG